VGQAGNRVSWGNKRLFNYMTLVNECYMPLIIYHTYIAHAKPMSHGWPYVVHQMSVVVSTANGIATNTSDVPQCNATSF
jgi:hypothetical protein